MGVPVFMQNCDMCVTGEFFLSLSPLGRWVQHMMPPGDREKEPKGNNYRTLFEDTFICLSLPRVVLFFVTDPALSYNRSDLNVRMLGMLVNP